MTLRRMHHRELNQDTLKFFIGQLIARINDFLLSSQNILKVTSGELTWVLYRQKATVRNAQSEIVNCRRSVLNRHLLAMACDRVRLLVTWRRRLSTSGWSFTTEVRCLVWRIFETIARGRRLPKWPALTYEHSTYVNKRRVLITYEEKRGQRN